MSLLIGIPKVQYFHIGTKDPLVGGKVYSYISKTTIETPTYPTVTDADAMTNANANPVILDENGQADIVVSGSTSLILTDSNGIEIWSFDNLNQQNSTLTLTSSSEVVDLVDNDDAVNLWYIDNSATGDPLHIQPSGTDTNIQVKIASKSVRKLRLDGGATGTLDLNSISTGDVNIGHSLNVDGVGSDVTVSGVTTVSDSIAATGDSTVTGDITVQGALFAYPGTVMFYAGSTCPYGWLECDGSAIDRTTYARLFAVIGSAFGDGNHTSTFNLPNQARRVNVGRGSLPTAYLDTIVGSIGGEETHILTIAEYPSHTHTLTLQNSTQISLSNTGQSNLVVTPGTATGSTGSDTGHNNMQPSIVMMMMIKAF